MFANRKSVNLGEQAIISTIIYSKYNNLYAAVSD